MKEPQDNNGIIQRLDVLIGLTLDSVLGKDRSTVSGKIQYLHDMGLSAADTAAIVKKSRNYVTAIISQKKKRAKKDNRNG